MNPGDHYLFVYGSLLSGFNQPAFEYIRRYFTFVSPAKVQGALYDLGSYPAAIPTESDSYIVGELYSLNNTDEYSWAFSQLDDYEGTQTEQGEAGLYKREQATIYAGTDIYCAWIYWYNGVVNDRPLILSGNVADYFGYKK